MAHGYRTLQHWNQWLSQHFLGKDLLEIEQQLLTRLLSQHFGKHALLIGVPHQSLLLKSTHIPCQTLMSPLPITEKKSPIIDIEGDFDELPILTGSIDLVILPHSLELIDNPRQLLTEACRVIKPGGLILICGFNPYSIWGIKKILTKHTKNMPWAAHFIQSHKIKGWLQLADFALEKQTSILFRPPMHLKKFYQKLHFLENIGNKCFPIWGGVYVLQARAKVVPPTPIKLQWKQRLSGIRISTTISGHIARQSK